MKQMKQRFNIFDSMGKKKKSNPKERKCTLIA